MDIYFCAQCIYVTVVTSSPAQFIVYRIYFSRASCFFHYPSNIPDCTELYLQLISIIHHHYLFIYLFIYNQIIHEVKVTQRKIMYRIVCAKAVVKVQNLPKKRFATNCHVLFLSTKTVP